MNPRLIVALDFNSTSSIFNLVNQLDPSQCALKIGLEVFTLMGPQLVKQLVQQKFKIFLDLKFLDIPNTVAKACKSAAELGVWMINVHAVGGTRMMKAARKALDGCEIRPILLGVTVLTSMDDATLAEVGVNNSMYAQVNSLALLAKQAGLDGVVCSAHETADIKNHCGKDFLTVTPGIRFSTNAADDQNRIATPEQALEAGSDYLVVGRPITQAAEPHQMIQKILKAIRAHDG